MSRSQLTHWSSVLLLCCFRTKVKSVRIHQILSLCHFPFLAENAEAILVPQIPIKQLQYKKLKNAIILEARPRQKLDKNFCYSLLCVYSLIPPLVFCVYMLKSSFEKSLSFEFLFFSHILHKDPLWLVSAPKVMPEFFYVTIATECHRGSHSPLLVLPLQVSDHPLSPFKTLN